MRPLPGEHAWLGRQRPTDQRPAPPNPNARMSFFIADEASLDSCLEQPTLSARFRDPRKPHKDEKEYDHHPSYSPSSCASDSTRSPASILSQPQPSNSRPITPIMLGTSCTGSAISFDSLAGSLSDHAVLSDDEPLGDSVASMLDSGSAPQLVMPSIQMPKRRPFTDAGRNMGRLKVLIAGDSGVGKTSLVKAIVQACEHIVHVDAATSLTGSVRPSPKSKEAAVLPRRPTDPTTEILEVYASTRPYPEWWSELDEFRAFQRRKSNGDGGVLERNICFVDTPGYGGGSSAMETIAPCVEYVESRLNRVSANEISDSDMLNMLGGDGGSQVDVVLYLISERLKPVDVEYLRRVAPLTNVIPLLAQADLLSAAQIDSRKEEIAGRLQQAGIQPFSFTRSEWLESPGSAPAVPYTVSNVQVSDHEMMDASVLMSSDYVQPLVKTELGYLVENCFSSDGASWLRHAAAKKYLQWRKTEVGRPRHLYRPLSFPGPRQPWTRTQGAEAVGEPSWALTLARAGEAPAGWEGSQLHLVDWAGDLQRSLAAERSRYEALARGERAVWLTERLSECVQDGRLVAVSRRRGSGSTVSSRGSGQQAGPRTKQHQDPLGLLQVAADLKAKSWIAFELVGSLSVLGGLAFWLTRQHWQTEAVQLADEWARFLGMDI
ncbi:Septin-domain-containing protein [Xylariomycetidae sp. FL0641]|nr:Septin-domain-containing protein [Xylariomycetidae sp. FL0641]